MANFEIKDDYKPSAIFLIPHIHQRIASHPRVLQCGWKYLSRDFLKRKPQLAATTHPNC